MIRAMNLTRSFAATLVPLTHGLSLSHTNAEAKPESFMFHAQITRALPCQNFFLIKILSIS